MASSIVFMAMLLPIITLQNGDSVEIALVGVSISGAMVGGEMVDGVEAVKMMICHCEHLRELLITAGLRHPLDVGESRELHGVDDWYDTGMLTGLVRSSPRVMARRIRL